MIGSGISKEKRQKVCIIRQNSRNNTSSHGRDN